MMDRLYQQRLKDANIAVPVTTFSDKGPSADEFRRLCHGVRLLLVCVEELTAEIERQKAGA